MPRHAILVLVEDEDMVVRTTYCPLKIDFSRLLIQDMHTPICHAPTVTNVSAIGLDFQANKVMIASVPM